MSIHFIANGISLHLNYKIMMTWCERGGIVGIYSIGTYLTLKLGLVPEETTRML